jgi:hypothetical protein
MLFSSICGAQNMSVEKGLQSFSRLLDRRLRAAFEGNSLNQTDIRLDRQQAAHMAVDLRVVLGLSWESSWTRDCGYFHPADSVYCADETDLNNRLSKRLDAQVRDVAEAQSLERQYANGGAGLLVQDKPLFNVRAMENKWHCHEDCRPCRGRGNIRCLCAYGKQNCSSCFGKTHTSYSSTGAPPYVFSCGGCWGSGQVNCYQCGGTCWINCRNCNSQGGFTTTKQASITAQVSKVVSGLGSDIDGFREAVETLPIETIVSQGPVSLTSSRAEPGKVTLNYRVTIPYVCHGYAVGEGAFEVHALGQDMLVPLMPPVLDDVIGPVVARITDEKARPADVLKAAEGCRVTQEILSIVGTQAKVDTAAVARTFHNTVSVEMVSQIAKAIRTAYDLCGAPVITRIWIKSITLLNIVMISALSAGALKPLVRSFDSADLLQTTHELVFGFWQEERHLGKFDWSWDSSSCGRRRTGGYLKSLASEPSSSLFF